MIEGFARPFASLEDNFMILFYQSVNIKRGKDF